MEEQKRAERQWNKNPGANKHFERGSIRGESVEAIMAFQDYPFKTVTGLPFQ